MKTIGALAEGRRVAVVRVKLGALAHMDPGHFREHFEEASRGTVAEGASVDAVETADLFGVFLVDVELEA
jgi:hydrogenase nickel incorporation protein HypA/HybF